MAALAPRSVMTQEREGFQKEIEWISKRRPTRSKGNEKGTEKIVPVPHLLRVLYFQSLAQTRKRRRRRTVVRKTRMEEGLAAVMNSQTA